MGLLSKWLGPPTPEAFAHLVGRAVRAAGEARPYTFDAGQFCLRFDGDSRHVLNLTNAYRDYCAARRSDRATVLHRYAGIVRLQEEEAAEPTFASLRGQLLPRVRERFYFAAFDLNERAEQARSPRPNDKPPLGGFVLRTLAEALTLEVVIDYPTAIRSLARSTVDSWAMPFDDVLAAARENLWAISNEDFVQVRPGLFASPWRDTHDASRLALHDLIWQLPVRGRHVAAVPNRNVLLVTGDEDDDNLTAMAELAHQVLTEPRAMTGTLFRLDGSTWAPFLPTPASPAHGPVRRLAVGSAARDYAEQAKLLDDLHAATGQDVFVAKQTVMRRDDGSYHTFAVWPEGVTDGLLPACDRIALVARRDGKPHKLGFARWEQLAHVAGHRMEATDLYPPRWRVRTFPPAEELAALDLAEEPT